MKKQKYIVFGSPAIEEAEIKEVVKTLHSGWLGTGPKVAKFENCRLQDFAWFFHGTCRKDRKSNLYAKRDIYKKKFDRESFGGTLFQ